MTKKTCAACGGTGQVSFFMGVSRFLLTAEECPECAGLGYDLAAAEASAPPTPAPRGEKKSKKRQ